MTRNAKERTSPPEPPEVTVSDADLELPIRGFQGTPEEIERQWFEKIYTGRGDRQKQLTLRAVLMGGVLGMFMSISNLYTTLKLGWAFGVAITACVLSFVIWNALRALSGGRLSQMRSSKITACSPLRRRPATRPGARSARPSAPCC